MSSSVGSPPDTVGSSPRSGRASTLAVSVLSADMASTSRCACSCGSLTDAENKRNTNGTNTRFLPPVLQDASAPPHTTHVRNGAHTRTRENTQHAGQDVRERATPTRRHGSVLAAVLIRALLSSNSTHDGWLATVVRARCGRSSRHGTADGTQGRAGEGPGVGPRRHAQQSPCAAVPVVLPTGPRVSRRLSPPQARVSPRWHQDALTRALVCLPSLSHLHKGATVSTRVRRAHS